MSIIYLDGRVCDITTKHSETIGLIYLIKQTTDKLQSKQLNGATDIVSICFNSLENCTLLIEKLLEEPKEIKLSEILNGYKKCIEAKTLLEDCVMSIEGDEHTHSQSNKHLTHALFGTLSLLEHLVSLYEDVLNNPPSKQAA